MKLRWMLPILVLFGLALGAPGAHAQLLFAGGEDIDFTCNSGGNCYVTTNGAEFRPSWAREAYEANGTSSDPPTNRFATPVFSPSSTVWVHAQYCMDSNSCLNVGTSSNTQMLRVLDSKGNAAIALVGTGTSQQVTISSRTAAGVFSILATCPGAINTSLTQIDLYVNYGTSGEVTLYNNGPKVCDFVGNVTNGDGATTLDQVEFASPWAYTSGAWSEVIVATTDTRAMARFSANTASNGNTTGFSGSNICSSIWNATSFNDANFGYSGANSVLQECTINSSIPPGVQTVLGLVMSARTLVGATGPQHFDFLTRTAAADYPSAAFAPTKSFSNIQNYIQTVNPATHNPWAVTDFQASGFNVGEETAP